MYGPYLPWPATQKIDGYISMVHILLWSMDRYKYQITMNVYMDQKYRAIIRDSDFSDQN
jgi:hypothetical protein